MHLFPLQVMENSKKIIKTFNNFLINSKHDRSTFHHRLYDLVWNRRRRIYYCGGPYKKQAGIVPAYTVQCILQSSNPKSIHRLEATQTMI
jgi:hypothetical protein